MIIEGNIVDIVNREIFKGSIEVGGEKISKIKRFDTSADGYIMLGFIDSHLHIESSLLTPTNFSNMVIPHGTVGVVTDPHEIANVMGREGVDFMMKDSEHGSIRCHFTIPSSVPATPFDKSGGEITSLDVEEMANSNRFVALSEVMNVFGVISQDKDIISKIESAKLAGLAIDGHAPLLKGDELRKYADYGITTDHECVDIEEAKEKISCGMKILIREGSAARNYESLKQLIATDPENIMFCTDDSHPDEILKNGHIDKIVRRAVADGFDIFDVLRIACLNPINHYKLNQGTLCEGSLADFIIVDNLQDFTVREVYINGEKITEKEGYNITPINNFNHDFISADELSCAIKEEIKVIGVIPDEIITTTNLYTPKCPTDNLESDIENNLHKIVYINRYNNSPPVIAYCSGFKLSRGAFASSVSHDSHNILAVGCSDSEIAVAVNSIIRSKGGLSVCNGEEVNILPLPIAGIMSDKDGVTVASEYEHLLMELKEMGCELSSPFMTLSFLSLVVIPELKIGEKGLFNYSQFDFI